ncbi:hypothetical protein G7047_18940 [Diaphorobacter sp. HDW4A]|uniref:hypothetical protein n=1 Tax=Diaphorobacter sp. HDW4A TaxID=2714924 RepID=UPI0014093BFE|nr:hypothetical protein [Diaphorobacter sp. HDW4A]QIL81759.1 hypothetical protein G7047_18940 [Diaphorobacter sp. HDW4A]
MPDKKTRQYVKFRRWMRQPNPQLEKPPLTDDMAGMKEYLENAFWEVWQAGYNEALGDAHAMFIGRAREIRSHLKSVEGQLRPPEMEKGSSRE